MYADGSYNQYAPYEQCAEDIVDDYIRVASYETDQSNYARPHRPTSTSRQSQAAVGRARLSLPPSATAPIESHDYQTYEYVPSIPQEHPRGYVETQETRISIRPTGLFAPPDPPSCHHVFQQQASSSSPMIALPSTPAYQASQRQQNPEPMIPTRPYPTSQQKRPITTESPPIVQGIRLVPVHTLPDRFQTVFPFAMFNAVQSACFESIYESHDNCVFSSPTGSGKTVLFEIAICRMLRGWQNGTFKIVYMAPTKSLCSERAHDWKAKFEPLGLKCEEMTGDSDITSLQHVQRADIIVTTPEKWDSMTRKWKDHERLVRLIKLLLIDEVHILNKDRGATLEVVVSRMKSIGSGTRFIALSATVPNSQDIATWLGRNDDLPDVPATHKKFGQEFRPVELKRYVCGYQSSLNAFAFDAMLNRKLPEIITKYSQRKPIMIFCFTRKSCSETAKALAEWWKTSTPKDRYWDAPTSHISVEDRGLQSTVTAGVAVHHAGLDQQDRSAVERAYLVGDLSVICCTSTLAVGVNLPCHMVIIKNTVSYEAGGLKEYSDLEIMQMIGRAGRPQFDTSALATIMTKMQQVKHYEQLLDGQERLESCLHLNLVEHLNAEIGLAMVPDLYAAKKWLAGTFLKVRLEDNPAHYQIDGDTPGRDLGARLEQICEKAVSELRRLGLIEHGALFKSTEYGDAMARYYMNIATMESILNLPRKPKMSDILTVISQSHEFREIRFRSGEKQVYKELNGMNDIRYSFRIDLSAAAHKVSLIIQAVLGGVNHIAEQTTHRFQYSIDQSLIFHHVYRLIRCIVDCQNINKDAVGIRNSLMLSRSLAARVWDDSPMVLQQIEQIGPVAVRKLINAGITSIDELSSTDPGRVELVLNKASPYGMTMHRRVQTFPRLRVGLQIVGQPTIKPQEHVAVKVKIDFGFLNNTTPVEYRNKRVFVIVLLGTSDGRRVNFFRLSAAKLQYINPITETTYLTSSSQLIECYVMCDDLAGTMQEAVLKPDLPVSAFQSINDMTVDAGRNKSTARPTSAVKNNWIEPPKNADADVWDDGGVNDDDFFVAESKEDDFMDVDALKQPTVGLSKTGQSRKISVADTVETAGERRLENGNYACHHRCKDKSACKHPCCKGGMERKPKPRSKKTKDSEPPAASKSTTSSALWTKIQSKLELPIRRKAVSGPVEHLDLSQAAKPLKDRLPMAATRLASLHESTSKASGIPTIRTASVTPVSPTISDNFSRPSFKQSLEPLRSIREEMFDDATPSAKTILETWSHDNDELLPDDGDYLDPDEDMLEAALVGLEDSQSLQHSDQGSQSLDMLDFDTVHQQDDDEPELFVTAHPSRVDGFAEVFQDAVAMVDQNIDDVSTRLGLIKRKLDDGTASDYLSAKKARTGDKEALQTYTEQSQEQETNVRDGESKEEREERGREEREKEELRAWLAAELGDSVEMI